MKGGLVSITFRELSVEQIVELVAKSGLTGIEWGGDIHVPHGDIKTAERVQKLTVAAGLACPSYGSYYRCDGSDFRPVLDCALALKTPIVRVWAGKQGSEACSANDRATITADAVKCAKMCRDAGVTLAFEYHANTLTDTPESAKQFLADVPMAQSYWQPNVGLEGEPLRASLAEIAERVVMLHVFQWNVRERRPLIEGEGKWKPLLSLAPKADWALIEFVKDNTPEQYLQDAQALSAWLKA